MAKNNIIFMGCEALLQATKITDVESGDKLNTAIIKLSIFDGTTRSPADVIAFTNGGGSEAQTSTLDAKMTGGHFHLTYKGLTTAEIAWNATTAQIKTALETLGTVDADDIIPEALHEPDTELTCIWTFAGSLGDVPMLSMDVSAATGPTTCVWEETTKGGYKINEGDVIEGMTSGATAVINKISLTSGYWSAGTAAGQLELTGKTGTFQAEDLRIDAEISVATLAGDSTSLAAVLLGGGQVKIPMNTVGLTTADFVRIESTKAYDGQYDIDAIDTGQAGYVTITATNTAETFKGTEVIYIGIVNGKNIPFTHEESDDEGYYDGKQPNDLGGIFKGATYYLFERIVEGAIVVLHCYRWDASYYSNPG